MTQLFSIKPLEWAEGRDSIWTARPLSGIEYRVASMGNAAGWWCSLNKVPSPCASPEEGKQLAEQHWNEYVKQALEPAGSCLWKYDPDGYWQTGCGEGFTLSNEESLSANAIRFCHACGKRIEELVPEETNE